MIEFDYDRYETDKADGLRTRDNKSRVGRGGYSYKQNQHYIRSNNESPLDTFIRRTSQILDITKDEVPELLVAAKKKSVRVNQLKFAEIALGEQCRIVEEGLDDFNIEKLPWYNGAFLFDAKHTPSVQSHELTQEGKTFIQNPSSFLPVIALEPSSGGSILDMCAAPGGKTALIAALARHNEDAEIFANEPKSRRAQRLREVLGMLGANNVVSVSHDGRHLISFLGRDRFDKILVDAECSTDSGINFESSNPMKDWNLDRVRRMSILQKQLITSAYDMLSPGGILVYSTCTLSPEENEEVVMSLLERRSSAIIQPMEFSSELTARNLKKWNGKHYTEGVFGGVVRVCPNEYMDSFCLARIRKPTGDRTIDKAYEAPIIIEELIDKENR